MLQKYAAQGGREFFFIVNIQVNEYPINHSYNSEIHLVSLMNINSQFLIPILELGTRFNHI